MPGGGEDFDDYAGIWVLMVRNPKRQRGKQKKV
jgi:hypothetical protein